MRARQAGYFCLFPIVENRDNKDSVLDIRLLGWSEREGDLRLWKLWDRTMQDPSTPALTRWKKISPRIYWPTWQLKVLMTMLLGRCRSLRSCTPLFMPSGCKALPLENSRKAPAEGVLHCNIKGLKGFSCQDNNMCCDVTSLVLESFLIIWISICQHGLIITMKYLYLGIADFLLCVFQASSNCVSF